MWRYKVIEYVGFAFIVIGWLAIISWLLNSPDCPDCDGAEYISHSIYRSTTAIGGLLSLILAAIIMGIAQVSASFAKVLEHIEDEKTGLRASSKATAVMLSALANRQRKPSAKS